MILKECFCFFFMTCIVVFSCMVISLEIYHIFDITTAKEAWFAWFLLASYELFWTSVVHVVVLSVTVYLHVFIFSCVAFCAP